MLDDRCDDSLSFALQYLGAGLSIFPLISKGKKPTPGFKWEPFQYALPDQEQVKSWLDGTNNNIAFVTGAVSRLVIFDTDGAGAKSHSDDVTRNRIRIDARGAVVNSIGVETGGGGLHLWIRYKPGEFTEDEPAARECRGGIYHRSGYFLHRHNTTPDITWLKRQDWP